MNIPMLRVVKEKERKHGQICVCKSTFQDQGFQVVGYVPGVCHVITGIKTSLGSSYWFAISLRSDPQF